MGELEFSPKPPAPKPAVTLEAHPADGQMKVHILKATDQHELLVGDFEIQLEAVDEVPTRIDAKVALGSLQGGPPGLVEDLASEPFFDLATFPAARLRATHFVASPDHPKMWTSDAELTVQGLTYPARVTLEFEGRDGYWHGDAQMEIDPRELGFESPSIDAEMVHGVVVSVQVRVPTERPADTPDPDL